MPSGSLVENKKVQSKEGKERERERESMSLLRAPVKKSGGEKGYAFLLYVVNSRLMLVQGA